MSHSSDEIAINSIQQHIRRVEADSNADDSAGQDDHDDTPDPPLPDPDPTLKYSWFRVGIRNRSITDSAKREDARKLLLWVANILDRPGLDHQLLTIEIALLAGESDEMADEIAQRKLSLSLDRAEVQEHED